MKWLLTGGQGMLATDLTHVLTDNGEDVTCAGRDVLDVTRAGDCLSVISGFDVVVNAAAWTAVDDAESHETQAFAVNAVGAANIARACRVDGARLVHISTDYVFSGDATRPYAEDAALDPRSAYGRTKAAGEWAVRAECPASLVVRTAWLYGAHGPNFVKTMSRLGRERDSVAVVDDQHGQPTWAHDLAEAIVRLVGADAPAGIYHGTSAGSATWFTFTQELFGAIGLDPATVRPTTTDAFPRPAPRPTYSVLGHDAWQRAGVEPIRDWREAIVASAADVVGTTV